MMRCPMCLLVLLSLASSQASAQSDGEKAFKSYTDLAVGGTWECEISGKVVKDSYRRILDGKFVRLTSTGGKDLPPGTVVIGVDPATNECTWWSFTAEGAVGKGTITQTSDTTWEGEWTTSSPKGNVVQKGRLTKVDNDTIKYEVIEQDGKGKVGIATLPKVTEWKRVRKNNAKSKAKKSE